MLWTQSMITTGRIFDELLGVVEAVLVSIQHACEMTLCEFSADAIYSKEISSTSNINNALEPILSSEPCSP